MMHSASRRTLLSAMLALPFARPLMAQPEDDNPLRLSGPARQGAALQGTAPDNLLALMLDEQRVDVAPDGQFIIAFDRDAGPLAVLQAHCLDDRIITQTLAVTPGDWQIEQVNAPLLGGAATSEEFAQRRASELTQIAAARGIQSSSQGWRQRFIWPVKARVSGRFGAQRVYQGTPASYHSGLDLAGGAGTAYVAPADGEVVLAAQDAFTLEGKLLIIDHGMGLNSAFLHSETLLVGMGERVVQGQALGRIGATGRAAGPHLHWGMKWHQARIDPATFVGA